MELIVDLVVDVQGVGLTYVQRASELSLRCHEKRRSAWAQREDGLFLPAHGRRRSPRYFSERWLGQLGLKGPCGQTHAQTLCGRMQRHGAVTRSYLLTLQPRSDVCLGIQSRKQKGWSESGRTTGTLSQHQSAQWSDSIPFSNSSEGVHTPQKSISGQRTYMNSERIGNAWKLVTASETKVRARVYML